MSAKGAPGINHVDFENAASQNRSATPHSEDAASALQATVGRQLRTERDVDVGVGQKVALLDSAQRPIEGSTTGVATFQSKTQLGTLNLVNGQAPGEVLLNRPLDVNIDETVQALANRYVNYRIKDLSLVVENTAPFAAASGSMQLAYINDPENQLVDGATASEKAKVLDLVIRQSHSKQVKAKDTAEMRLDADSLNVPGAPSNWKFCKSRPGKIFSQYGTLAAIVRAPPAIGDGATFPVSLAITWEFYGMTNQLSSEVQYIVIPDLGISGHHPDAKIDSPRDGFWRLEIDSTGKNPITPHKHMQVLFDQPVSYLCHMKDEYDNVAQWYGFVSQAQIYNHGAGIWYFSFPAESSRFDGLVGEITRYMEFPNRIITGVVPQFNVVSKQHVHSVEHVIAKSIAQGMSILTSKMANLEFKFDQFKEDANARYEQNYVEAYLERSNEIARSKEVVKTGLSQRAEDAKDCHETALNKINQ